MIAHVGITDIVFVARSLRSSRKVNRFNLRSFLISTAGSHQAVLLQQSRYTSTSRDKYINNNGLQFVSPIQNISRIPERIVFGSCSSQLSDLSYWDRIVENHPDLIILMGDNVYAPKESEQRPVVFDDDGTVSNSIMAQAYDKLGSHPSFAHAARTVPIIATLDDNDYNFRHYEINDASNEEMDRGLELSKTDFLKFFQTNKNDIRWTFGRGVYTSYNYYVSNNGRVHVTCSSNDGDSNYDMYQLQENDSWSLQIIVLDVRRHASPFIKLNDTSHHQNVSAPLRGPYIPSTNKHHTILGETQWKWFEEQCQYVHHRPALRIIVSPIQVISDGCHGWDCWNLFPHERERLLSILQRSSLLSSQSNNRQSDNQSESYIPTVILSGDRHVAGFYEHVFTESGSNCETTGNKTKHSIVEVTSSSLTHSVPVGLLDHDIDSKRVGNLIYENNFGLLCWDNNCSPKYTLCIHCTKTGEIVDHRT